jgi:tRNA1Val (adenine37-N6)-methyltransferase
MDKQVSNDTLRGYDLLIKQPERGYRFSLDALLLADFVRLPPQAFVVDLGTGCGVLPLMMARKSRDARFVAFENNPDMVTLASENVRANGLDGRVEIVIDDILNCRPRFPVSSFDLAVSNPPFRTPLSGKVSPVAGRDLARHESTAGLSDFLAAAKYLVKPGGRICFIYHPSRLAEFIAAATDKKLALLRLRMVHGTLGAEAKMFLAELAKGRKGDLTVEPPLIVYDDEGKYCGEASRILDGGERRGLP